MSPLPDPSASGAFNFESVVYAAPNLIYSDVDLDQYTMYHTPSPQFGTRRIDISLFAEFDARVNWPFSNTATPLNGIARIPIGDGPFPLVLFAHGNHNPFEHSTPGYIYLCELLATHGVIAATIDVNFLNGSNRGENDGRAIVHLEHVKQFLEWNTVQGHPLEGKIDTSRIMIAGHSRGGEAVGHASLFNRLTQIQPDLATPVVPLDGSRGLGPYGFSLNAIVAIAPTDRQYIPITGATKVVDNYFVFHGSLDNDVINFPGYRTFDRSHAVNLANPAQPATGFKTLLWIHGANHNFFNSVWDQESSGTITRAEQEAIAKVYISAMAQAVLLNGPDYLELFRDHSFGLREGWLAPAITLVSQYQDPVRIFAQHSQEPGVALSVSAPASGSVNSTGVAADKLNFNLGPVSHLFQETFGGKITWNGSGGNYRIDFTPRFDARDFSVFALRAGQSFEPQNPVNADQDFSLVFEDGSSTVTLTASSINRLVYPSAGSGTEPKTVMQTLRVSLRELEQAGLNPGNITSIKLIFDRVNTGRVYLDDIQFTQ